MLDVDECQSGQIGDVLWRISDVANATLLLFGQVFDIEVY